MKKYRIVPEGIINPSSAKTSAPVRSIFRARLKMLCLGLTGFEIYGLSVLISKVNYNGTSSLTWIPNYYECPCPDSNPATIDRTIKSVNHSAIRRGED